DLSVWRKTAAKLGAAQASATKSTSRAFKAANETDDEWALRLWRRMDRDSSGKITLSELKCEEFHNIIRHAVAPESGTSTGGAQYGRTKVNIDEAIKLCLRKADSNHDKLLSFEEFRSLLLVLKEPHKAKYSANLVFALFDLNANRFLDRAEFRELYRFLLGRNPTEIEFEAEWDRLASLGSPAKDLVTQEEYTIWLRFSDDPAIRQMAPEDDDVTELRAGTSPGTRGPVVNLASTRPKSMEARGLWNQMFNAGINPGHVNDNRPAGAREYFSRSHSLPELKRFWEAWFYLRLFFNIFHF
ncbi:unnamed protein product, partial [Polarella glacialis]